MSEIIDDGILISAKTTSLFDGLGKRIVVTSAMGSHGDDLIFVIVDDHSTEVGLLGIGHLGKWRLKIDRTCDDEKRTFKSKSQVSLLFVRGMRAIH